MPGDELARRMGRVMRSQARESWLVPLLVVPLTEIVLSPVLTDDDLNHRARYLEGRGKDLGRRARSLIDAILRAEHRLTDEDPLLLVETSHDLLPLASAFLYPPGFLLAGAGIDAGLEGEPLRRATATWIVEGDQSPARSAFVITQTLAMDDHPMEWLPRASARNAVVTRAIDRRMFDAGMRTGEDALGLAAAHWRDRGWLDLQLWQMTTEQAVNEQYVEEPRRRAEVAHDADLSREKARRASLQGAASALESEVAALRPLKDRVEGLRVDAERLRLREAELTQARDRALARAEALERQVEELRRAGTTNPGPPLARADPPSPVREVVYADELPLPADLLAGRQVFFFTGETRKSSAESAAESLRELGADDIRTFSLRKGSDGPDPFPPGALVVVDIRFVGHSQSGVIADRAERSKAQYLAVRSGKGSLARTVAAALQQLRGRPEHL